MSINVTVHGNPISIKRGKMVTYDADSEFERRRRIRLQQVRQQSKEIAADVRNRVRKEKEKQLTKAERQGEKDLKRWQARKLLTLQQQYRDCIKEVGSAHTKAALERDPNEVLSEIAEKNLNDAEIRGKQANEKQKIEEEQRKSQLSKPIEQKKYAREIENARSAMVSNLGKEKSASKKKKRKKIATDVTITNNLVSESSENSISDVENTSTNMNRDSKHAEKSPRKHKSTHHSTNLDDSATPEDTTKSSSRKQKSRRKHSDSRIRSRSPPVDSDISGLSSPSSYISDTCLSPPPCKDHSPSKRDSYTLDSTLNLSPTKIRELIDQHRPLAVYSTNTRISERIRQRKLNDETNKFEDKNYEIQNNNFQFISNDIQSDRLIHRSPTKSNKFQIESYKICDIKGSAPEEKRDGNLPYVPTTSLRPELYDYNSADAPQNKVKYYDHFNHFSKEYQPQPVVQKISKDSIHVQPPTDRKEAQITHERMQRRDREAHFRGMKAMEKAKIQKDYKELMEELPVLQRQERLASMKTHNPAFHMSDDRLKDLERRRQNRIENIFEKYYHKSKNLETPLITVKPVQKSPPPDDMKLPFKALDVTESPVQLNVAEWNSGDKSSTSEGSNTLTGQAEVDELRKKQMTLADLLQRVNRQRDLLLKEVSTLPPSSNLQKILQDEELLKLDCPCPKNSPKPPSDKVKIFKSTATSPLTMRSPTVKPTSKVETSAKDSAKRTMNVTSSSDSSVEITKKKHKKSKGKKQKVLIKNEGTQTSPAIGSRPPSPKEIRTHVSDVRHNTPEGNQGKLCEIIIKMAEESSIKISTATSSTSKLTPVSEPDKKSERSTNIKGKKQKSVVLNLQSERTSQTQVAYDRRLSNDVSTSTAYMSPPEVHATQKSSSSSNSDKQRQLYKDLLHYKPQQTNIDQPSSSTSRSKPTTAGNVSGKKEINQHLLKYIQKLLSMSRQSIDDLTVSSVSDVSTPGNSVLDTSTNNPLVQLQNVMNHFNLSFSDIQQYLNMSESSSLADYAPANTGSTNVTQAHSTKDKSSDSYANTTGSSTTNGNANGFVYTGASATDGTVKEGSGKGRKSPKSSNKETVKQPVVEQKPEEDSIPMSLDMAEIVRESFGFDSKDLLEMPYSTILSKYKELTQSCCDKITNLTSMIDKVRLEKERLLSPLSSDKNDNSITSYMDLPARFANETMQNESNKNQTKTKKDESSSSSSSDSLSQDALDRYLLAVNGNSPRSSPRTSPSNKISDNINNVTEFPVSDHVNDKAKDQDIFIPMLQGIPKYSNDENQQQTTSAHVMNFLLNSKPKPPPALLRNAAKYNMNIDMTPHELSTIVELDTVASSRNASEIMIQRPRTPDEKIPSRDPTIEFHLSEKQEFSSENSEFITISPERHYSSLDEKQNISIDSKKSVKFKATDVTDNSSKLKKKSPSTSRNNSPKKTSRSTSPTKDRPVSKGEISGVQALASDRSTSSPEDMEAILRNMGLGWAVSTLKKTQEALALSSSSSSTDHSKKQVSFKDSSSSSNSEVSLRDVLSKNFLKKLSSSSLLSETSDISPSMQELQDLSEIPGGGGTHSKDRSQQRTSTPVQQSKSTDSKTNLFAGDSDLSSVRLNSDENLFLSIPNVTLDTNISLNKTKK